MRTIAAQIEELENETKRLREISKVYDKSLKILLGADMKTIQKILQESENFQSDFEKKIIQNFGLKTQQDFEDFIFVFCTENSVNFFKNKRPKNNIPTAPLG